MFIIYQSVIVAVATAPVLLAETCGYVTLAIISVIVFNYGKPKRAVITPEVETTGGIVSSF